MQALLLSDEHMHAACRATSLHVNRRLITMGQMLKAILIIARLTYFRVRVACDAYVHRCWLLSAHT